MNKKTAILQWMVNWQKASYQQGITLLMQTKASEKQKRRFIKPESKQLRKDLLLFFGKMVQDGQIVDEETEGQADIAVYSHTSQSTGFDGSQEPTERHVKTPAPPVLPVIYQQNDQVKSDLQTIPEITQLNLHRDELAQILVVNHANLKQATTDNDRKILMDEQTDIQKQRKEIRRKINLLKAAHLPR